MHGASPPIIYTVGHGSSSLTQILELLESYRVQTVVDVRSQPYSNRAPDFVKKSLEGLAAAAGLGYRWIGDRLGGRPDDPGLRDEEGRPDWDRIAASPRFQAGVEEVVALASGGTVALLCAEGHPDRCHRSVLIAPALESRGYAIFHILPDGSLRSHQPRLDI